MKTKTKFKQTEIGMIPEDWELLKLGSLCEVKSGKRLPKGKNLVEYKTQHPYIRVRDLANGTIKINELLFLDDETFNKISRYTITKDDVYISIVGTIGMVGLVPDVISGANLTENCARLTNIKKTTKEWLSYFLNTKTGQDQIRSLTVGTTQGKLALFRIKDINIPLPPLSEQQSIAKILSDLDSKIELNNQMNKTLEAIGQAIFKHWFIDFEFSNEKGKPYKSSGGEMVDSELGEIPKGWSVKSIDEIAEFLNGLAMQKYPAESEKEYLPVIKIKELKQGITESSDKASLKLPKEYIVNDGDVLFSWSGSLEVVIWTNGKGALNQHLFKVSSKEYPKWLYYYWVLQHLSEYKHIAEGKATTMGHIQRGHLHNSRVLVPDKATLTKMDKILSPIIEKLITINVETRVLSQIRDSILPKLMSGKIRVPVEVKA
jgi:type I restriction enzyme S subunit